MFVKDIRSREKTRACLNAQVKICTIFREMEHPQGVKWQETTFLFFFFSSWKFLFLIKYRKKRQK